MALNNITEAQECAFKMLFNINGSLSERTPNSLHQRVSQNLGKNNFMGLGISYQEGQTERVPKNPPQQDVQVN